LNTVPAQSFCAEISQILSQQFRWLALHFYARILPFEKGGALIL